MSDQKNLLKHRKQHQLGEFFSDHSSSYIYSRFDDGSLRAMYGKDLVHNAIDVSPSVQQAKDDIHMIFGDLDKEEHGTIEK